MSVRSVSNRVMTSLHVTCFGAELRLRLGRMRHPRSYIVRTAKITGMLRRTALILWMFSESTVDGLAIPTYVIVGSCYSAFHLLLYLPATSYKIILDGHVMIMICGVGSEMTSAMCLMMVLESRHINWGQQLHRPFS